MDLMSNMTSIELNDLGVIVGFTTALTTALTTVTISVVNRKWFKEQTKELCDEIADHRKYIESLLVRVGILEKTN